MTGEYLCDASLGSITAKVLGQFYGDVNARTKLKPQEHKKNVKCVFVSGYVYASV
tara:strand:+ start:309 stop:473 length:165 start_codon:yes stop_codon:yes gene_type:complete